MTGDPYVDPVTRVLRNSLGISRPEELAAAERELTLAALYRIERQPIPGNYDLDHLCSFHREIFRHVYPWAGEIRTVARSRSRGPICSPSPSTSPPTAPARSTAWWRI